MSVLNRTVQAKEDGSWVLPNVPANFGPVRARATCVQNGVTVSGDSEPFTLSANGIVNLPPITLGKVTPIPTALSLTTPTNTLTAVGQTMQLTLTARYSDNTTKDVTAGSAFTQYTVSNPTIATVTADGQVQAVKSGTVLIQATHEGASGMAAIIVMPTGVDSDGDGIPDDYELAHGMNPNDPTDAMEDFDRDGLTNLEEYRLGTDPRKADTDGDGLKDGDEVARGTNPLLRDTDGDGISDGLEVQTGSNPLDPTSFNLGKALSSLTVTPSNTALAVNTVIGEASRQLVVTGTLRDGTQINLTATAKGTNYSSSNLNVCNFGAPDGRVFAGASGSCTVTVSNSGFSATVNIQVSVFTPVALGFVSIPGFANNVAVSGNYAYVAAGATGLQVVDVSDRRAPKVVAALDTPGNANDVKVVGNTAFIADGPAGLRIIDITNPLSPKSLGTVDTPGNAQDVVVQGNLALVADGGAGLQVINITDPTAPFIVSTVATSGVAQGVDVHLGRNIAVVANGTAGIRVIDISNIARPVVIGNISTGNALDVVLSADGNTVFVADLASSLTVVDISNPASPVRRASTPAATGGLLTDVALSDRFAFGADVFFVNGVPIVDVGNPLSPIPRAILDFRNFRDDNGTGIAVDGSYVYLTAAAGSDSRLYIGQYLQQEDTAGIAPTVAITTPAAGITVIEGARIPITVAAVDDVSVNAVDFLVNGAVVSRDTSAPYQFTVAVPKGVSSLTLGAKAVDFGGNVSVAADVVLNVIPDPLTTVVGVVVDQNGTPVAGAAVTTAGGRTGVTLPSGAFSITGVPTVLGDIVVKVSFTLSDGTLLSGRAGPTSPVLGGGTDVGNIKIVKDILREDFEKGVLDSRISIRTLNVPLATQVGTGAGLKDTTAFGSTKAYGFGRSSCGASCFGNFTSTLRIDLGSPTFVSTISFKFMELFDNWGSQGTILVDGTPLTGGNDFEGLPSNGRVPDTTFQEGVFTIDRVVTVIELRVVDITNLSEIFIDDLVIKP